jgi:hypothetical protein
MKFSGSFMLFKSENTETPIASPIDTIKNEQQFNPGDEVKHKQGKSYFCFIPLNLRGTFVI